MMSGFYQIQSNFLIVQISTKGAEMKRLFSKGWAREVLWPGDEKHWNRSAPVLFPIVGKLKDDQYHLKGRNYTLAQHGFARDLEFKCIKSDDSSAEFLLVATQHTFDMYPFVFELRVKYQVVDSKLTISYFVKNDDRQDIYFSIGAHPAFVTKKIEEYEIRFKEAEDQYFLLKGGLVDWENAFTLKSQKIALNSGLFKNDALIFKQLKSKYVDLVDIKTHEVIRFRSSAPYWGIWGKGEVPFVCVEPWYGIADNALHDKNFETKEGIITLPQGEEFEFSYSIEMRKLE